MKPYVVEKGLEGRTGGGDKESLRDQSVKLRQGLDSSFDRYIEKDSRRCAPFTSGHWASLKYVQNERQAALPRFCP